MTEPLRVKKPAKWFVNSMSDLFHEDVPDAIIDKAFAVMALCQHHTFQILTKRSERMRDYLRRLTGEWKTRLSNSYVPGTFRMTRHQMVARLGETTPEHRALYDARLPAWPLPNVWLGVSVEDQKRADERIPDLLATPAAVRWISAEPLLGALDLTRYFCSPLEMMRALNWVVVGGESGRGARPMHPDWARSIRDQCADARVPFFFKQWGEWFPECQWEDNPELILPTSKGLLHLGQLQMHAVGKGRAGRLLDGREHNGFPGAPVVNVFENGCGND